MFWHHDRKTSRRPQRGRSLKVEALESRQMLSGIVNLFTVSAPGFPGAGAVAAGDLLMLGDVSGNSVKIQSAAASPNTGQFVITSGDTTTLFRLNPPNPGTGPTLTSVAVDGISGSIQVDLGLGNDVFDFEGTSASPPALSTVLGNLNIIDHVNNVNRINNVVVSRNLNVSKAPGSSGYSELDLGSSTGTCTVVGSTIIDNQTGGGGGDSLTAIANATLQGYDSIPALTIINGAGNNVTQIAGNTQIGTGLAPTAVVVSITNGAGGSFTSFSGPSSGTAEVFGGVSITNGSTFPLQLSQVVFSATQVLGAVHVDDTAGGDTTVSVANSRLGSQLLNGGPLVVNNGSGVAQFTMSGSDLPWGLYLNDNPSPSGSPWGSITTITSSQINDRPPQGSHPLPSPADPADAAFIAGGSGPDQVTITGSTFVGQLHLALDGGTNNVKLDSSTMACLNLQTGSESDTAWIGGCTIQSSITVNLGAGSDTLSLETGTNTHANSLPDPLLGALLIDGGLGVDTLKHDNNDPVPVNLVNFEILLVG